MAKSRIRKHLRNAHLRVRAFGEWVILDGKDKVLHFLLMAVLGALLSVVYGVIVSVLACTSLSLAKEVYDRKIKKTDVDLGDLTADSAGIIVGLLIFALIEYKRLVP